MMGRDLRRFLSPAVAVVGVLVVLVAGVFGYRHWLRPANQAKTFLDKISVDGFSEQSRRTHPYSHGYEDADALFIGPPIPDQTCAETECKLQAILRRVDAPGLTLNPLNSDPHTLVRLDPGGTVTEYYTVGWGDHPGGFTVTVEQEIENPSYNDRLDSAQRAAMKNGTITVLHIAVTHGYG
ncbi:hypothetical protein ACFXHA_12665 [Nocardia sp. NPDC059240]|uniref:hypothetical protein n=1 Tax=Nocardia sp. NPDC059240 TaxID=3346786 RepID=UPI0036972335